MWRWAIRALTMAALLGSATPSLHAEILKISTTFNGQVAELSADTVKYAGAVYSFKLGGVELIDSWDHGRLLQIAVSYDDLGGCYNPTEAGNDSDYQNPTSSSVLLSANNTNNILSTSVNAAFWFAPGPTVRVCGTRTDVTQTVNTTVTGDYLISKQVSFGYRGIANAIEWLVTFSMPEAQNKPQFEVLTGYMPARFSVLYEFNPNDGQITRLASITRERGRPIIVRDPCGTAMGIYCPGTTLSRYQYLHFYPQNVVKWNCLQRAASAAAGDHQFRAVLIFGTLAEVVSGMIAASAP